MIPHSLAFIFFVFFILGRVMGGTERRIGWIFGVLNYISVFLFPIQISNRINRLNISPMRVKKLETALDPGGT
ncbi:hypothetical protein VN97_g1718 [Penicillium thymicola]|uniref:Uncharacterized protein n=1 Tax=Penicillium thymicola TaxID=293382 RepID=A0AAI9TRR3_PENTH|nr:hypothetical protein VN97_g1718 [Penicillium thymicola]